MFPCRYPIPACVCTPGPRICGRSPIAAILDSWIAGSASNVRSPAAHSASTTGRLIRLHQLRAHSKRVASPPRTTDGEKTHFAAPHTTNGPGPIHHAGLEKLETLLETTPDPSKVQGWKSRTHERRPVPTLTGASQQPGGVFLPILLQPGHTLFKVLQTNRSSCGPPDTNPFLEKGFRRMPSRLPSRIPETDVA